MAESMPPLSALVMIACPVDGPSFDVARVWTDLEEALREAIAQGLIMLERLSEATENALKRRLSQSPYHVFHFIGHGHSRLAQYGTLVFEDSSHRARSLNAQYLGGQLKQYTCLKLAILQAAEETTDSFAQAAARLVEQGFGAVVTIPRLNSNATVLFVRNFYASLAFSKTIGEALSAARDALAARGSNDGRRVTLYGNATVPLFAERGVPAFVPESATPVARMAGHFVASPADTVVSARTEDRVQRTAKLAREAQECRIARELECKRVSGQFDVFMCHNWRDKPAVKRIAQQLQARGILPWLDEWELPPGQPWQPLLEQQIANIKSAAVFVGAAGVGPWQEQELYGFLREFAARRSPVIPVLLLDAPDKPELPIFLRAMTWVDFRVDDPDPLEWLIWGVTGKRTV